MSGVRASQSLFAAILLGCLLTGSAYAADSLAAANAALQAGKADEAARLLNAALASDPKNAEADNLLCRVEYSVQHFDQAAAHCEKAVSLNPQNGRYHLWLGRALGERASRASFLSAYSLAKRTRSEFEEAVRLAPADAEALADLGEFYNEAPGAVGGGTDKAEEIARKLASADPPRAHNLLGAIAEKKKDLVTAEREFKTACTGNRAAIQWMELASYYRRHENWSDLDAAISNGATAAGHERHAAVAFFNGASILARANRSPDQAIKLYSMYLSSPDKTEEAPAFEALTRLSKLRRKMGDTAGAERDRAAALALAHDYKPALDANQDTKN